MGFALSPTDWAVPHFGLLWGEIRADYPSYVQLPYLPPVQDSGGPVFDLINFGPPAARIGFVHSSGERLLQIQHDRFLHNWKKASAEADYPRYETIRPIFVKEWDRYRRFRAAQGLPAPHVATGQVTYINHIEKGAGWNTSLTLAASSAAGGLAREHSYPHHKVSRSRWRTRYL